MPCRSRRLDKVLAGTAPVSSLSATEQVVYNVNEFEAMDRTNTSNGKMSSAKRKADRAAVSEPYPPEAVRLLDALPNPGKR